MDAESLADLIGSYTFTWYTEQQLQDGVERVFTTEGVPYTREARLTARDRPDFLAGDGVGVELKVKGGAIDALRQLQRYAGSPLVRELLLVTTTYRHADVPATIGGKPLRVLALIGVGQ